VIGGVLGRDAGIVPADKFFRHLFNVCERTAGVADDVFVAKVLIGREPRSHRFRFLHV